ncbi:MAG: hypothetical protein JNK33_05980 [Candidatus Doudnabacteria bacterium]|nr:hypothetical protein [Candidatus Doudnabacteria bacterium]
MDTRGGSLLSQSLMKKAQYPFFGSKGATDLTKASVGSYYTMPMQTPFTFDTAALTKDTFSRDTSTASAPRNVTADNYSRLQPKVLADQLKLQYQTLSGPTRNKFFQDFVSSAHQLNSHQPSAAALQNENTNASLLSRQVQQLDASQRVDFIRQLTGDQSAYTKYVEKVLVYQQQPTQRDLYDLFRPQPQNWSGSGIQEAFSTMALGLLSLPVVIPAMAITSPTSLGAIASQIGLWLV